MRSQFIFRDPDAAEAERRIDDWARRGYVHASDRATQSGRLLPYPEGKAAVATPKTVLCSVCYGGGKRGLGPCRACGGTGRIAV